MKILLLGNGGREHAIAKALKRLSSDPELYVFATARNPGILSLAAKYEISAEKNFGAENDFEKLRAFARENTVDFAVLGPDDPICAGAADALRTVGAPSIGPTKSLARLEGSKSFTRDLVAKYGIPGNPRFRTFTSSEGLAEFCYELKGQFVVKDDGLCGGKGVSVAGDHFLSTEEGIGIAENIRQKRGTVVIEEKLTGQEFSLMCFVDGNTVRAMPIIQDHKRAFEGDQGPNTGGMGTYSYPDRLPFLTSKHEAEALEIVRQTMLALEKECGEKYKGIMYGGFMATPARGWSASGGKDGIRLIEFNARFGDPEALNALTLLESDFVEICRGIIDGNLAEKEVRFAKKATVCKYVVPEGYPENPVKEVEIKIGEIPEGVETYYASVDERDGKLYLKGSRAVGFVGVGETVEEAEELAEKACLAVSGPVFHRRDIGTKDLIAKRVEMMRNL